MAQKNGTPIPTGKWNGSGFDTSSSSTSSSAQSSSPKTTTGTTAAWTWNGSGFDAPAASPQTYTPPQTTPKIDITKPAGTTAKTTSTTTKTTTTPKASTAYNTTRANKDAALKKYENTGDLSADALKEEKADLRVIDGSKSESRLESLENTRDYYDKQADDAFTAYRKAIYAEDTETANKYYNDYRTAKDKRKSYDKMVKDYSKSTRLSWSEKKAAEERLDTVGTRLQTLAANPRGMTAAEQNEYEILSKEYEELATKLGESTRTVFGKKASAVKAGAAGFASGAVETAALSTAGQNQAAIAAAKNPNQYLLENDPEYAALVKQGQEAIAAGQTDWTDSSTNKLYGAADKLAEKQAVYHEEATKGATTFGKVTSDIVENMVQMAGDAVVGRTLGVDPLAVMALRTYGSGAQEARQGGYDQAQQMFYGTLKAGVEAGTEKLFDGFFGVYGKGTADEFTENLIKKLAKESKAGNALLTMVFGALGEANEEAISGLLDPVIGMVLEGTKSVTDAYGTAEGRKKLAADVGYSMLIGGLCGLIGSGGKAANILASKGISVAEQQAIKDEVLAEQQKTGNTPEQLMQNAEAQGEKTIPQTETQTDTAVEQNAKAPTAEEQTVKNLIADGVSNSKADAILADPALRAVAEAAIGQPITGAKSEQRSIIKQNIDVINNYIDGITPVAPITEESNVNADTSNNPEIIANESKVSEGDIQTPPTPVEINTEQNTPQETQTAINETQNVQNEQINQPAEVAKSNENVTQSAQTPMQGQTVAQPQGQTVVGTNTAPQNAKGVPSEIGYDETVEKYGAIEKGLNPARDIDVPRQISDVGNEFVSEAARSVAEAEITPEERIPTIKDAVLNGELITIRESNPKRVAKVSAEMKGKSYQSAVTEFRTEVASGRINADTVTKGALLIKEAGNNDGISGAEYLELVRDYVTALRHVGKALQAGAIIKKLSPEGRLYLISKEAQRISDENASKISSRKQRKIDAAAEKIDGAGRQAVSNVLKDMANETEAEADASGQNMVNTVFTFEYADEAADIIAKAVEAKAKPKPVEPDTAIQQLAKSISKFATERVAKPAGKKGMTATEVLAEYAQNEEFAREAYQLAQQKVRENAVKAEAAKAESVDEFANPEANEPNATESFYNEAMSIGESKIVAKALAESALRAGETAETIRRQAALGMSEADIGSYIANDLINQTGAEGELADTIREVAAKFVSDIISNDTKTVEERADALTNEVMRRIGESFRNLATQDRATRGEALQAVRDILTEEYGIDGSSASAVAEVIGNAFDSKLQDAVDVELKRLFGAKEAAAPRVKTLQTELTKAINLDAFDSVYSQKASESLFGVSNITIDPALIEEYRECKTDAERDAVIGKMQQSIADQMPSTLKDKFNALRYTNMLGNFKTQGRNLAGNAASTLAYLGKSRIKALMEAVTGDTFIDKETGRTSAIAPTGRQYRDAWNDFENVRDETLSSKYEDWKTRSNAAIQEKRTIFKQNSDWGKGEDAGVATKAARKVADTADAVLEGYRKATGWAMDTGDIIFNKVVYADALAGWMKANGYESIDSVPAERLDAGRAYAVRQAQEVTFRNDGALANLVQNFDSNWDSPDNGVIGKVAKTASKGVLTFRKTPANVLERIIEYTAGDIKAGVEAAVRGLDVLNARENISPEKIADDLAKGLTGKATMVLGYTLASMGKLRVKDENDDRENFEKQMGQMDYSYVADDGTSTELTILSPQAAQLFLGAKWYECMQNGFQLSDLVVMTSTITEYMLEQSMLSGLEDALSDISGYGNEGGAATGEYLFNALWSWMTQGFSNSLIRQLEQATQKERQTSYTDGDSALTRNQQRKISKLSQSIPGWDYQTTDYIDAWGRKEDEGGTGKRIWNAFFAPAYSNEDRTTEVDNELLRLSEALDSTTVLPKYVSRSSEIIDGEKLTDEEYQKYAITKGQTSLNMVKELMASSVYETMTDEQRAEAIKEIYTYAADAAKAEYFDGRDTPYDSDYSSLDGVKNAAEVIGAKNAWKSIVKSGDMSAVNKFVSELDSLDESTKEWMLEKNSDLERYVTGADVGLDAKRVTEIRDKYQEIKGNESYSPTDQATSFANYLYEQTDLNPEQRQAMLDTNKFSSGYAVSAESYENMINAGFSAGKAAELYNAYTNLQPENGAEAVTKAQKYKAISGLDWSTNDKLKALELIGDSPIKKFQTAVDCGMTYDSYCDFYIYLGNLNDAAGSGNASQYRFSQTVKHFGLSYDMANKLWSQVYGWSGSYSPDKNYKH